MRMWLHIFLQSLLGIANLAGAPVRLYCMEYSSKHNGSHVYSQYRRVVEVYPEYGEYCQLQIVFAYNQANGCYPIGLNSPPEPMLDTNFYYFNMACYEYNFCTVNLQDKLSYTETIMNTTGQECLLDVIKLLPAYWGGWTSEMYKTYKPLNDTVLENIHQEFVFDNNQTRYYTNRSRNTTCFNLYQHVDDPFKANKVLKRREKRKTCSLDIKFDAHRCTLIRLKLFRGRNRPSYRFHKDREVEDAFTIGTWCEGAFCNRNLSYLIDNLRLYYEQTNLTNCALKAVQEAIDLYSASLENVYQTHMNLSKKERKRIEIRDSRRREKDLDLVKRKPKPLIERFQPVNQELLRESDYHIEMGKKSHMWIQYTILTYTTLALVISITCGIRKKRREQEFNIQRDDI